MNRPKTIVDLIDSPRINDVEPLEDISEDAIEIRGINTTGKTLESGKYSYIDLSDTVFSDLAANNIMTFRSTVVRCVFTKSQLTGIHLPEGTFKDVFFENCRLNLTNFRNSVFERCVFINCDLSEADFGMSRFNFVLFESCQFTGTDFSNAKHTKTSIEKTSLSEINGISGLAGVAISQQNLIEIAPLLAHNLGIIIRD